MNWSDVTGEPAEFTGREPGGEGGGRFVPPPPGDASNSKHYYLKANGEWENVSHDHNSYESNHVHDFAPYVNHNDIYVRKDQHDHSSFQVDFNHNYASAGHNHDEGFGTNHYYNGNGNWQLMPEPQLTQWYNETYSPIVLHGQPYVCSNRSSNPIANLMGTCTNHYEFTDTVLKLWMGDSGHPIYRLWTVINTSSDDEAVGVLNWGGWANASDRRLKDNISTIKGALHKIQNIRGVTFQKKRYKGDEHEIGVVAQEIEPYVPEVIVKGDISEDKQDYLAVSYSRIAPLLIQGVKELDKEKEENLASINMLIKTKESLKEKELKELKEKNKALKEKLAYLTKRIHAIESKRAVR